MQKQKAKAKDYMNSESDTFLPNSQSIQNIENPVTIVPPIKIETSSSSIIINQEDDIIQLRRQVIDLHFLSYNILLSS